MPAQRHHTVALRELVYPSNLLTLARLLMLPAGLRYLRRPEDRWRALLVFAVAMLTDALDGPVARQRHEVSQLGKVLDPIADKLMIDTTAIVLSRTRGFPGWVTGLLLLRDLGIVLGALFVYRRRAEITVAHASGKATTLALTIAMLLYVADGPRSGRPTLYLALLPFLYSAAHYLHVFYRHVRGDHRS
jgi:CDP-diacylglycerol---glycerol-3-phosphate 3-phosphatidyltransferase